MPGETPALGPTVYYIYSGDTVIGEISSVARSAPNGQIGYTTTPIAAYTWGAGGLVSEHRFVTGTTSTTTTVGSTTTTTYAMSAPTAAEATPTAESFWYAYGPQGETRQLVNASGAVADTYSYSPYGDQAAGSATGTDPNPFQFGGSVGYYTDPAMQGLILCGQRWYAPAYERWLSRDPVGYGGGANLYQYCDGNPVETLDPSGCRPPNAFETGQILGAIAMIRCSGMKDANAYASGLTYMLHKGNINIATGKITPGGEVGSVEPGLFTTGAGVVININEHVFTAPGSHVGPSGLLTDRMQLASVLVHERTHAQCQGQGYMLTHPNGKEDQAYGKQLAFLRAERRHYAGNKLMQELITGLIDKLIIPASER